MLVVLLFLLVVRARLGDHFCGINCVPTRATGAVPSLAAGGVGGRNRQCQKAFGRSRQSQKAFGRSRQCHKAFLHRPSCGGSGRGGASLQPWWWWLSLDRSVEKMYMIDGWVIL